MADCPSRVHPAPIGRSTIDRFTAAAYDVTIMRAGGSYASGSDESEVIAETGIAPSFRVPARTVATRYGPAPDGPLAPGLRIGDFEILGVLGEGALAKVYLALQASLGRYVALKVSAARTDEARTLASLEHDHIVRVFSESLDRGRGLRLLCMQYVPGMSLERLIRELRRRKHEPWSGRTILEAIDALGPHPGAIDPAALRDREFLERSDRIEATCWIGARLAEALAYANARGVLHRDIKPANILVNPYGRPLLADFNLASNLQRLDGVAVFGGSLAFMSPEHLEAFNPEDPTPPRAVDERSDLYSLGVVLFELLTGASPFERVEGPATAAETLRAMAAERRAVAPPARAIDPEIPPALDRALRRCLDPDPSRRHPSATELARDLEGCRTLRRIEAELPAGPLTRVALRRPATMFALATFLPHLLGSAINISYNALQIVGNLTAEQQVRFCDLVLTYNAVVYPLCAAIAYRLAAPVFRTWREMERSRPITDEAVAAGRRRALTWPLRTVELACVGWLPGGLIFPLVLAGRSDPSAPIGPEVFGHFLASFWISGLIALTYSYFGVELMALRVVYPRLWADARGLRATMAAELGRREARLSAFELLASLIPLSGAALLIGLGPEDLSRTLRTLIGALIALGMAGVGLTHTAARLLARTLTVLLSPDGRTLTRSC
jgi:serine/threonine protein kinase